LRELGPSKIFRWLRKARGQHGDAEKALAHYLRPSFMLPRNRATAAACSCITAKDPPHATSMPLRFSGDMATEISTNSGAADGVVRLGYCPPAIFAF